MSFVDKLQSSRGKLVYLVTGVDTGKPAWYYVQVKKAKLQLFKSRNKDGSDLTDYGTILYSGWGTEPPENKKQKIKEQFGS
jgi:hypothetical protein